MDFDELQHRLLGALRKRLQQGEISERSLARLIGISQPHMHNVLKGARILSPEIADRILWRMRISLLDLFPREEVRRNFCQRCTERPAWREVPILDGWLAPGLPLPNRISAIERYPFPTSYLSSFENPLIARLGRDPRMREALHAGDLALLDHTVGKRTHPSSEGLYLISRHGEGIIRRVRNAGACLHLLSDDAPEKPMPPDIILLAGQHLLDIIRAKVVWMGRGLESG